MAVCLPKKKITALSYSLIMRIPETAITNKIIKTTHIKISIFFLFNYIIYFYSFYTKNAIKKAKDGLLVSI